MEVLKTGWNFFQNEILGMQWLNRLIGNFIFMWCERVGCVICRLSNNTQAHFSPVSNCSKIRIRFSSQKALKMVATFFSSISI